MPAVPAAIKKQEDYNMLKASQGYIVSSVSSTAPKSVTLTHFQMKKKAARRGGKCVSLTPAFKGRGRQISEFKASLFHKESSRTVGQSGLHREIHSWKKRKEKANNIQGLAAAYLKNRTNAGFIPFFLVQTETENSRLWRSLSTLRNLVSSGSSSLTLLTCPLLLNGITTNFEEDLAVTTKYKSERKKHLEGKMKSSKLKCNGTTLHLKF